MHQYIHTHTHTHKPLFSVGLSKWESEWWVSLHSLATALLSHLWSPWEKSPELLEPSIDTVLPHSGKFPTHSFLIPGIHRSTGNENS